MELRLSRDERLANKLDPMLLELIRGAMSRKRMSITVARMIAEWCLDYVDLRPSQRRFIEIERAKLIQHEKPWYSTQGATLREEVEMEAAVLLVPRVDT